jgi:ABC-type dipeptide/oligopeptide/nickel transport system permease component
MMAVYLLRRLGMLIPVLLGVSFVVFLILYITPGDPAEIMLGVEGSPEDLARLRHEMGLDQPFPIQYVRCLGRVVQGDLGRSLMMKTPVLDEILHRFRATLLLTLASLLLSTTVGVLAGVISATRQYSAFDRLMMLLALFGISMPVFWLGLMLILLFSVTLGWFPPGGMFPPTGGGWQDVPRHLALPALATAAPLMGIVARFTRSSMLEILHQDFIRTARAKGLPERGVLHNHALRNALIPTVTVVGLQMGFLLGGAVVTETVFSWPGLGSLMMKAIFMRDFPVVQGGVLLIAFSFVLVNLVVDVLYVFLDPRIKLRGREA